MAIQEKKAGESIFPSSTIQVATRHAQTAFFRVREFIQGHAPAVFCGITVSASRMLVCSNAEAPTAAEGKLV